MKQKLLLFCLMCLITIGMAAKEMTVRILDTYDSPIAGLSGYVSESGSSWGGDYGHFTTDENGEFTINRTNMNFMDLYLDTNSQHYELVWDGSDNPVEVKLEGYCLFIFRLTGMNLEPYGIADIIISDNHEVDAMWDEDGIAKVLLPVDTETNRLTWRLGGQILCQEKHVIENINQPTSRDISIDAKLSELCLLEVSIFGRNGKYAAARIKVTNFETGEEVDEINTYGRMGNDGITNYYIPTGTYNMKLFNSSLNSNTGNETINYLYPAERQIRISNPQGREELNYNYQQEGHDVTIQVLDIDGQPSPEASIQFYADNNSSGTHANADQEGKIHCIAFSGTYKYNVWTNMEGHSYSMYDQSINVSNQDITETISFEGQYFRVSLDVKLPAFITDRNTMEVMIGGYSIQYNDATGLYTVILKKSEEDYKSDYRISYPNMKSKRGFIQVTKHETITVDLAATYHTVTFIPSDANKYALSDISIIEESIYGNEEYNISGNIYYMEDGEYKVKATVTDLTTQESYQAVTPQAFTVNGENLTVTYTLNTDDYHKVTITVIGADGTPMANQEVSIYSIKSGERITYKQTDSNGIATFNLLAGEYSYSISPSNYSPYIEKTFTIDKEDLNFKASFEGYKKLTVKLTGDLISSIEGGSSPTVWVYNYAIGVEKQFYFYKDKNGDYAPQTCYLQSGEYSYRVSIYNTLKTQATSFKLNEDEELAINLSTSEYHKVTLKVVDENGTQVTNGRIYIQTPAGKEIFGLEAYETKTVYLPNGNYKAVYLYNNYQSAVGLGFVVSGEDKDITLTRKEPGKNCTLTVKIKGLKKTHTFNYAEVGFYCEGFNVAYTGIEINRETGEGENTIELPAGTYTYSIYPDEITKTGTITISENQELILDYSSSSYLYVYTTDEAGNRIYASEIDDDWEPVISINQEGKSLYMGESSISGLFPQGTYEIWAWCYGYKVVTQSVTITDQEQSIAIKLPKANPNNFTVYFSINDEFDNSIDDATVNLNGYGEYPTFESELVFADVAAGNISYTVEADGYETYTGTVEVNKNAVDEDGLIEVEVYLKTENSVAIEKVTANNAFRIYPTVIEDYIHICPNEQESAEWNIRLTSATGATVYMDKQRIDGDMEVFMGNLPKGLYILMLSNGTQMNMYKVIKK